MMPVINDNCRARTVVRSAWEEPKSTGRDGAGRRTGADQERPSAIQHCHRAKSLGSHVKEWRETDFYSGRHPTRRGICCIIGSVGII
jgi:hypothetical protein